MTRAVWAMAARDLVHRPVHERTEDDGEAREDVVVVRGAPDVGMARQSCSAAASGSAVSIC
jgi:hypothetical protein